MMLATCLFCVLYPWQRSWPKAGYLLHLPWTLIPMWVVYEWHMPDEMNIRMDLLLIVCAFGVVFTIYAIRLVVFALLRKRANAKSSRGMAA